MRKYNSLLVPVLLKHDSFLVSVPRKQDSFLVSVLRKQDYFLVSVLRKQDAVLLLPMYIVALISVHPACIVGSVLLLPMCIVGSVLLLPMCIVEFAEEYEGERGKKAAYHSTPDNWNKRQDDCDVCAGKRSLVAIVTGSVTRSSTGLQTGRTDLVVGDRNLLNESFREEHNIRDIVTVKVIPLNADVAVDPNTKVRVRMRPTGEGKDSWEHCLNQSGKVALPEAQFLCISQLLCGRSSFPASATWFLETPKKCPPSSTLEAVVEIELVTPDASSSAVNLVLPVEIQEKEVPNICSDPELSSLWLNTDIDGDDRALEEKFQTEAMEK